MLIFLGLAAFSLRGADRALEPRWSPSWPASPSAVEGVQVIDDGWILVRAGATTKDGADVILHRSRDEGATWEPLGNVRLPAGVRGSGRRYGSAVVKQPDGVLRLLMTTDAGCLWEASWRPGRGRWTGVMPMPLRAGAGPLALRRLASGRVGLAWIRPREWGEPSVWFALSHNDTVTWTFPLTVKAIAVRDEGWDQLSLRETVPGQLLLSSDAQQCEFSESDFLQMPAGPDQLEVRRVVMMGDSITRGARPGVTFPVVYSELLRERLRDDGTDVHNVGIGAERTDLALLRLEADVLTQGAAVVTLMYGTNDSYIDARKSVSRLTVAEYRRNLEVLVTRLRAAGVTPMLMTPPRWGARAKANGLGQNPNVALAAYVETCRAIARQLDVPLVDHHRRWSEREAQGVDIGAWTTDQCHPNAVGHAELAAELLPVLQSVLRQRPRRAP